MVVDDHKNDTGQPKSSGNNLASGYQERLI